MKKIFSLLAIAAMCTTGFVGCNKATDSKKVTTETVKPDGTKVESEKTDSTTVTPGDKK